MPNERRCERLHENKHSVITKRRSSCRRSTLAVEWTYKDRKKPKVVQELTRMIRQLREYTKVDGIRETAHEMTNAKQEEYRKVRNSVLSAADIDKPPPGWLSVWTIRLLR